MKALAYLRVSTDRQELGPQAQLASIREFAARQRPPWEIVDTFEDQESGAEELPGRPGALALLRRLESEPIDFVVARDRTRVARDVFVAVSIDREVERRGAIVATADGVPWAKTPTGQYVRRIMDANAELERGQIVERITDALAVKRRRRELVGAVPFGARLAPDGVHLEEADARFLRLALAWRAAGESYRTIARRLWAEGYRPHHEGNARRPRTRRLLHPQSVARLLVAAENLAKSETIEPASETKPPERETKPPERETAVARG